MQAALEQAYRNTLLVGRFPACVLYVELSCAAVDVNVHPAKTEVKFSHERAVFDTVYYGARAALEAERAPAAAAPKQSVPKPEPVSAPAPKADPFLPAAPSRSTAPGGAGIFRRAHLCPRRPGGGGSLVPLADGVGLCSAARDPAAGIPRARTHSAGSAARAEAGRAGRADRA